MEHLIPTEWFVGLPQWALLLIAAAAIAALVRGADWLVDGASSLAVHLGVSKVIVGATVVSLGTTSPEAGVSVMAAWGGEPGLALGNAIGSIVADTGLIFGLGCLLRVLPADAFVLRRQGWVQIGSAALLAALCYAALAAAGDAARLDRWVGLVLLVLLAAYMAVSVRWSRQHPAAALAATEEVSEHARRPVALLVGIGLVGLVVVLLASRVTILAMTELAEAHWHVPKVVVAATIVALGTSLPEMVIGLTSVLRGHPELLVGNVVGADVLNVLFVVGASAAAAPLPLLEPASAVPHLLFVLHLPAMLLILAVFRVFIHGATRRGSFRRWQGIPLLALYAVYAVTQYVVG